MTRASRTRAPMPCDALEGLPSALRAAPVPCDIHSITRVSNTSDEVARMKITTKGQVTIPADIRERLGLLPNTEVEFTLAGNGVMVTKARRGVRRGQRLVAHLRGRGTVPMSTEEILALTREG